MPDYVITLAQGNPNGFNWGNNISISTSTARSVVAQLRLVINPAGGIAQGVRLHIHLPNELLLGETITGITNGIAAALGVGHPALAGGYWPVVDAVRLI